MSDTIKDKVQPQPKQEQSKEDNVNKVKSKDYNSIERNPTLMSIDEAIKHCEEKSCGNNTCALEHKQLEKWLIELKELKEQKPSWSKEDKKNLNWVINVWNRVRRGGDAQTTPAQMKMLENWLKSLKSKQN